MFVVRIVVMVVKVVLSVVVSIPIVGSGVFGRNLGMRSKSVVRLEVVLVLMRVERIGVRVRRVGGGLVHRVHAVHSTESGELKEERREAISIQLLSGAKFDDVHR